MDALTRNHIDNLFIKDAGIRYDSFKYLIDISKEPVDWAYEIWDDLLKLSEEGDNHQRTIAVQLLANLAKSDPKERIVKDMGILMKVTRDEKFVTARHSLQSLWKIAVAGKKQQHKITGLLADRFQDCVKEKNCRLVRYDIVEVFRKIYDVVKDESVMKKATGLIETEKDDKYRKKYAGLWKDLNAKNNAGKKR